MLCVNMTSAGKSFNKLTDFMKKVEGLRRDVQDKSLAKKAMNS